MVNKIKIAIISSMLMLTSSLSFGVEIKTVIEDIGLKVQDKLFAVDKSYTVGEGDLTLVFFYDYNCPYSRVLDKVVDDLIATNDIRVIYKPLGIIDNVSPLAAKSVLAAKKQDKFMAVHDAFVAETKPLSLALIQNIISTRIKDLDKAQYDKDYKDMEQEAQIYENRLLYDELKVEGVPAIIGAKLDSNNKVVENRLSYFAGVNRQDLVYMLYKLGK